MDQYLKVGIITSTHGIKGDVKVYPTTSDLNRFKKLKTCYFAKKDAKIDSYIEMHCNGAKFFKNQAILHFEECKDINEIEQYRQYEIWVKREDADPLKKDEYYMTDLIELLVKDEDDNKLGVIKEIIETGANDVYVVKGDDGKELLIPAIKQCILDVNVKEGFIVVHLLEGMV